jgi:hypothetical protein
MLVEAGADINEFPTDWNMDERERRAAPLSALSMAVFAKSEEMIRYLVDHGAKLTRKYLSVDNPYNPYARQFDVFKLLVIELGAVEEETSEWHHNPTGVVLVASNLRDRYKNKFYKHSIAYHTIYGRDISAPYKFALCAENWSHDSPFSQEEVTIPCMTTASEVHRARFDRQDMSMSAVITDHGHIAKH